MTRWVSLGPGEISAIISHVLHAILSKENKSRHTFYMLVTVLSILYALVHLSLTST